MRITLFDYGAGNLHSLAKALGGAGDAVRIDPDPESALDTDLLVLPGVGAFASAAERLEPGRAAMRAALETGLPCLGVCLGMQLLFESSEEGPGRGLAVLAGKVERLRASRVPHIGWNTIEAGDDATFHVAPLATAYYAHGYACRPDDPDAAVAWTTHEHNRFPAAVRLGRTLGVQFHPEKSSRAGVRFLHAYLDQVRAAGHPSARAPGGGANATRSRAGVQIGRMRDHAASAVSSCTGPIGVAEGMPCE